MSKTPRTVHGTLERYEMIDLGCGPDTPLLDERYRALVRVDESFPGKTVRVGERVTLRLDDQACDTKAGDTKAGDTKAGDTKARPDDATSPEALARWEPGIGAHPKYRRDFIYEMLSERALQEERWTPAHDSQQTPLEWVGLITLYLGRVLVPGDWASRRRAAVQVAALALSMVESKDKTR